MIHWRILTILKTSNKSVRSNFFWYNKVIIFWIVKVCSIHYMHWDLTQMLIRFPLGEINVTKNSLFFLKWAPTHPTLTFNSRSLHELKHKVHISETVSGIFLFQSPLVFIKVCILVNNKQGLFDSKTLYFLPKLKLNKSHPLFSF